MPSTRYDEEQYRVDPDSLVEHASLALARAAVIGLPGIGNWMGGAYRKDPVTIYDINGRPLFHDLAVNRSGETLGHVRLVASRIVGPPVVSVDYGSRGWDFDAAAAKLAPRVKKEFPRVVISPPKLVCYCYPKLGVMYEIDDAGGKQRAIFDITSLNRVPEASPNTDQEGFFAYSYFDSLNDDVRGARLKKYTAQDKPRLELTPRYRTQLKTPKSTFAVIDKVVVIRRAATRLLQYSSFYASGHARAHHCFQLMGQQVDDYCAVATCQMVLAYYRYYFTQANIAPSLGYSAGGGCPADQSPGYESLTCNHLDAAFDNAPTWQKAKDEIDALHPFKSGIAGHARACAGYSYSLWTIGGAAQNMLYIYDPWMWNADYALGGEVKWEDWDAITHTNYVTTRVNCP